MHYNSREGESRVQHELNPIYYKPLFEAGSKGSEFENSRNKINWRNGVDGVFWYT
jgi:hypothetical protein